MSRLTLLFVFLPLMALLFSPFAAAELKTGEMAPQFSLFDQHQKSVSLQQQRGNWVVLYFYPKNDTPGCTTEACSFRDNINRLIAQQAVILGVSVDSISSHQKFAEKYRLPFSLLADKDAVVAQKYDAVLNLGIVKFAKRHSFIIDPQGRIARIYRNVDPQKHVAQILKDLKQLQKEEGK
ncbi:peroxiredoxin [Thiomicrorhabdus xiamenensis]|uniref:thioredoxin-dependent peroxiredoxin n=1 Tax=Thiomicrorhabdus xiamenensis TaxID=2739063 RepID=A0A7D4SXM7_9GAMM|nr:peroxiredoxin [Thiomicrorhabdus xiamenensis]QKI88484.1 peroxiredoxin [Thiomicrorhabdus xiamenensis]